MRENELSKKFELKTGLKFNTFYTIYKPKLVWHLTKYTKDQEVSEDFADDAFTQALLKIDNYNIEKSQIHTWVYKIAENLVKKDFKDKGRMNVVSMDKENDDSLNLSGLISNGIENEKIEEDLILLKKVQLVKESIHSLPEKYKKVMVMRELEHKSYTDIADSCVKFIDIDTTDEIFNLESPTDLLDLEIDNNGDKVSFINIYYNEDGEKKLIQFDINPGENFNIDRDDIDGILNIEIISNGRLNGYYRITTNLSTIKSQISKGRQLVQSMVSKKFRILDEQGIF